MVGHAASSWLVDVNPQISWEEPSRATTPLHEHHFCSRCGCTTYGISPAYSLADEGIPERKKLAVNAKLVDDYALLTSLPLETIDGRNLW